MQPKRHSLDLFRWLKRCVCRSQNPDRGVIDSATGEVTYHNGKAPTPMTVIQRVKSLEHRVMKLEKMNGVIE